MKWKLAFASALVGVAATVIACSSGESVHEYRGYGSGAYGFDYERDGQTYPGLYFTFRGTDSGKPMFGVNTKNTCELENIVNTAVESFKTQTEIVFKAIEVAPNVLALESCPVLVK